MTQNEFVYVADVGGTNARFGLATKTANGLFDIQCVTTFPCADFDAFEDVFLAYKTVLADKAITPSKTACIAIAAIIKGESVSMTSLPWAFTISQAKQKMGLDELFVINDFVGQAMAVPYLPQHNLHCVKAGEAINGCPVAVLGPGTGLGSALIMPFDLNGETRWLPAAAQGGHVNFAPTTNIEHQLCQFFLAKKGYVSFETFVCGSGISHIYEGLHTIYDKPYAPKDPADIAKDAVAKTDSLAQEALNYFFSFLGRFAGNAALLCGATGGVYLAGGILPKVKVAFLESDFNKEFVAKGVSSGFVENIPVYLMEHDEPALLGCAAFIENQF